MMTSFAFILGVVPLMVSAGAGAEMRQTLGTAVFSGMLGVTLFGIFLTPGLLLRHPVVQRQASRRRGKPRKQSEESDDGNGDGDGERDRGRFGQRRSRPTQR